ncbi:ELRR (Extracellular Leucine-Rich Repeat) ONly, partial [Trichostrongylus colubriformis]
MCCTMVNRGVFLQLLLLVAFVFIPGLSSVGKGTDKQLLSNESGWLACDGTETEACHCEQEEINCDNVVFEDESSLRTANLDIANKSFRVEKATFRENSISSLRQNAILPGHQGTVRELDFSHNRIVHIESGTFTPFRALNKLFLSNNKLNRLNRDQFLGLNALHQLALDNNKITSLQDGVFEHLVNLRRLVLDGNKIKFRKGMFEGLENLEELSMDNCDIKDLDPDVFETIPSLKKLSLRGNPFTDVPRAINSLKKLEYLDISNTNIAELHAEFLKDNHVLKQFYISNMPYLYSVQDCAFCGFERLERVYMNNCTKLQEIHPNAFGWSTLTAGKVTALTHFYVENCNLRTLSEDVLPWDTVTELGVGGNPWNCTCEIAFMLEDEYFSYEYSNTLPRCATPPELQGHLLIQVAHVEACDSMASL